MWFRIKDLTIPTLLVEYKTPAGICRGFLKYVRNRPSYRIKVAGGNTQTVDQEWLHAWRPVRLDTWPDPLPDPMVALTPMDLSPAPISPREPHHEAINPGIRLGGALDRPRTRQEAETRYLRWVRTAAYIERHGPPVGPSKFGEAWPRQLREDAAAVARWVRSAGSRGALGVLTADDLDDIYVDNALEVARENWQPNARDMSDYDHGRCMAWHNALTRFEQKLVMERAKNPPATFGEISTKYHRDRQWAHRVYTKAIDKIWRAAR